MKVYRIFPLILTIFCAMLLDRSISDKAENAFIIMLLGVIAFGWLSIRDL